MQCTHGTNAIFYSYISVLIELCYKSDVKMNCIKYRFFSVTSGLWYFSTQENLTIETKVEKYRNPYVTDGEFVSPITKMLNIFLSCSFLSLMTSKGIIMQKFNHSAMVIKNIT
jgi:hypothetical protein